MIALFQKTRLISRVLKDRLRAGHAPSISKSLQDIRDFLEGRRFGAPLTQPRPARPGELIGGVTGKDIEITFRELREDLDLLFTAMVALSSRTIDGYDVFSVRRDRLLLKSSELRQETLTLLAQQSAGTQVSITDSFKTLDLVDLEQTTARIDLTEGTATLPINNTASVRYDGTRTKVSRVSAPVGTQQPGPSFDVVFSSYRTNAWYALVPVGQEFIVESNVTGADFERGESEEVEINAIKIEPTGPIHIQIDWSPDGLNWHDLTPVPAATIRDATTFHFAPVIVGFIRFKLRHSEELGPASAGQIRPIGIRAIEFYKRGFSSSSSLYSTALQFRDTVHTVVAKIDAQVPLNTRIDTYVSQNADGPWLLLAQDPLTFDTIMWSEREAPESMSEETPGLASTMWQFPINASSEPIPELGSLIAGRNQVEISAFPFDWAQVGEPNHLAVRQDWDIPFGQVRQGPFESIGDRTDLTTTSFSSNLSPVAIDIESGTNSMILAIIQGNGGHVLQPGYNYRVRSFVWCPSPITLERQQIGVVNTGGSAGVVVAPFSFYVNDVKLYQQTTCVASVDQLSGMAFTTTVPFNQGWNTVDIYIQIPATLTPGVSGVGASNVFLYVQPNVFATNRTADLGIQYIQAYKDPWKRVSEFDLRFNVPLGSKQNWAWKYEYISTGSTVQHITNVLLNHDPSNSRVSTTNHPSYYTIDGQNAPHSTRLLLRYPIETLTNAEANGRRLYFRADFTMGQGALSPPILNSYSLLVN